MLLLLCLALPVAAPAQTFTSLVAFDQTDGANPYGTLAQYIDGSYYGTTQFGGANGQGTVYHVTPQGALTTLYSFCSLPNCTDSGQPFAGLQLGFDGNFYGTTPNTVVKINTGGQLTTLYTFRSLPNCADGDNTYAALLEAPGGNFYGTTSSGGGVQTFECQGGCGTVFKMTVSGALTTLYSFHGKDGYGPVATLALGTDGNFYGTTPRGGAHGFGTVFRITPAGALPLLHSFGGADGSAPYGRLVQATDGNFYGTTTAGGAFGYGAAFKMTPAGKLTLLRSFNFTNGATPYAGLVQGSDGNLYGTTYAGGSGQGNCPNISACGTIFRLTPSGQLTTLYNFCPQSGCPAGGAPFAALALGVDGTLYGTTLLGGSTACSADGSCGTIFRLSLVSP